MPGSTIKTNPDTQAEERIDYVPTDRGELYVWSSRPAEVAPCVMVFSSIMGEFTANYHRERLLGRELQRRGFGVVRFHYSGEGNSGGTRRDMTFQTLCADANHVFDHALSLGFAEFGCIGTRLGAMVAAATTSAIGVRPLALWEPLVEGQRFLVEALRAKRMSRVATDARQLDIDWRAELETKNFVDLLGHDIYRPLLESLDDLKLSELIGSSPRPVLLSVFGGSQSANSLSEVLVSRGFDVELIELGLKEPWWFDRETEGEIGDLGLTADWLQKNLETQS